MVPAGAAISNQARLEQMQQAKDVSAEYAHLSETSAIQQRINDLGFDCGAVDGIWGPRTSSAVRAFQASKSLSVDGIVGPNTAKKLGLPEHRGGYPGKDLATGQPESSDQKTGSEIADMPTSQAPGFDKHDGFRERGSADLQVDVKTPNANYGKKWSANSEGIESTHEISKAIASKSLAVQKGPFVLSGSLMLAGYGGASSSDTKGAQGAGGVKLSATGQLGLGLKIAHIGGQARGTGSQSVTISEGADKISFSAGSIEFSMSVYAKAGNENTSFTAALTMPDSKYKLLNYSAFTYENGTFNGPELTPGPDVDRFIRDAGLAAAAYTLPPGMRFLVGEVYEAVSGDDLSESEDEKYNRTENARLDTSWEELRGWWHERREMLRSRGTTEQERNQIFDSYVEGWKANNPGPHVEPDREAAAFWLAQAQRLEQEAIEAARKRASDVKTKEDTREKDVPLPPAIRGEVKHRVRNQQTSGSIPYAGVVYDFQYNEQAGVIVVTSPGVSPQTVAYQV